MHTRLCKRDSLQENLTFQILFSAFKTKFKYSRSLEEKKSHIYPNLLYLWLWKDTTEHSILAKCVRLVVSEDRDLNPEIRISWLKSVKSGESRDGTMKNFQDRYLKLCFPQGQSEWHDGL